MASDQPTLGDYVRVVRRRSETIALVTLLLVAAALLVSLAQRPSFEASAQVLLGNPSGNPQGGGAPDRAAQTEADLAATTTVAARALGEAEPRGRSLPEFLGASEVEAGADSDMLTFTVTDEHAAQSQRLATEYARQFLLYRKKIDRGSYVRQAGDAFLVAPAVRAIQIEPKPLRNAVLAGAIGLLLGVIGAFAREAVDRRIRSASEVAERLSLPLVGRLPAPPRQLEKENRLTMLAEPGGADAEPFRILRNNFDFFTLEDRTSSVMITSAIRREGRSTTAANLAIALARSGQRVILVDLDLRSSVLHRFFTLEGAPGLVEATLGQITLEEALAPVVIKDLPTDFGSNGARAGATGAMHVLPSPRLPADRGGFVSSPMLAQLLDRLRYMADLVIIDGPPLLGIGDAVTLSTHVESLLVVSRLGEITPAALSEARRVLATCPARKIGVVATAAELEEEHPLRAEGTRDQPTFPLESSLSRAPHGT